MLVANFSEVVNIFFLFLISTFIKKGKQRKGTGKQEAEYFKKKYKIPVNL
jgi:hypothetical protein